MFYATLFRNLRPCLENNYERSGVIERRKQILTLGAFLERALGGMLRLEGFLGLLGGGAIYGVITFWSFALR